MPSPQTNSADRTIFLAGLAAFLLAAWILAPQIAEAYHFFLEPSPPDGKPTVGVDFWINWVGSQAWLQGRDPYEGRAALEAVRGSWPLAHPRYVLRVMDNFRPDLTNNQYMGFVSSPAVLWLLAPLAKMRFLSAALLFWTISALVYATIAASFTATLAAGTLLRRAGAALLAVAALGIDSNIRMSLMLGQIDALYLAPLALACYLIAFRYECLYGRLLSGILLAVAAAVKGFPLLAIFLIGAAVLLESFRSATPAGTPAWKAVRTHPLSPTLLSAVITLALLAAITLLLVPPAIIQAWMAKLAIMASLPAVRPQLNPDLSHYARYLARLWGFGTISWPYPLTLLLMSPLVIWGVRLFAAATASSAPLRLLAMAMLLTLLPLLNPQQADYYNLMLIIPLIASLFAPQPPQTASAPRRAGPYILIAAGYLLVNLKLRMALMPAGFAHWWFTDDPANLFGVAPDNWIGGFPGNMMVCLGVMLLLARALQQDAPPAAKTFPNRSVSSLRATRPRPAKL